MIKNNEPLSMAEASEYIKKDKEKEAEVFKFIKHFTNLSQKEAKEFRKKIESLELMRLKPEHIAKLIDLMPENAEELNKIFIDVGLDEDETKKILETTKEFK